MDKSPPAGCRPIPQFFLEPESFSTKKERNMTPRDRVPPPPKPSARKLLSVSKASSKKLISRALPVSFKSTETSMNTPCYNELKKESYFSQCFEIICKLGAGSFGEVFKVRSKDDGKFYAVKKSRQKFKNSVDRLEKLEEVNKHEKLPVHRNCVKFIKAWEEKYNLYIQTELCKMSLSAYADEHHNIEETFVWNCLVDLLMALQNLHDHNLVHMDIKPENIFISKGDVCKLGDFGLVLDLNKNVIDAQEGDPKYLAPELLKGVFGKAADIFSLGITILELACDLDLPRGESLWHQLRSGQLPEEFLEGKSEELKHIIRWMMCPDHNLRPNVYKLLEHEFIKKIWEERILHQNDEEEELMPADKQFQSKTAEGPTSKISRELLSAFDNAANDEIRKKCPASPSLSPKHTPVNECSPHWHSRASSLSSLYDPNDLEKICPIALVFTPSDDEYPTKRLGRTIREESCGEDDEEDEYYRSGSPERKKLSF